MDYRLPAATAARGAGDSCSSPDPTTVAAAAAHLAAQAKHGPPAAPLSSRDAMKARIRARILAEEAAQERILEEEVRRELEIERGMAERLAEVQSLGLLPPSVTVGPGERPPLSITHHLNHTNRAGEGIGSIPVPQSSISLHEKAPMPPSPSPQFDPIFGVNVHHQTPYPDLHFQPPTTNRAGDGIGSIPVPHHHRKAPVPPVPPPPQFDPMFGVNVHHQPPYPGLRLQQPAHLRLEVDFPPPDQQMEAHFTPPTPLSDSGEELHSRRSDSGRGKDARVGVRHPKKIAKEKKKLWWEKGFGKGGAGPPPVVCMEICGRCGESGHLPGACLASKEEADWYQKSPDGGINQDDICFLCGKKGHWSRICRASKEVRAAYKHQTQGEDVGPASSGVAVSSNHQKANLGQNGEISSDNICFQCGKKGHWSRTCKASKEVRAAYKKSQAESKIGHETRGEDVGPTSSGAAVSSNHQKANLGQNGQISLDNICFQCGKKGHWSRTCKASKEVRAAYKKSQAESKVEHETRGEDVGPESSGVVVYSNHQESNLGQADMISTDDICFQCGKKGHWSRICKASQEERTIYKKSRAESKVSCLNRGREVALELNGELATSYPYSLKQQKLTHQIQKKQRRDFAQEFARAAGKAAYSHVI